MEGSGSEADAVRGWLAEFEQRIRVEDVDGTLALFAPDGTWRDLVALSWDFQSFKDLGEIRDALRHTPSPCIRATSPSRTSTTSRSVPNVPGARSSRP